jgi:hypothetical protein
MVLHLPGISFVVKGRFYVHQHFFHFTEENTHQTSLPGRAWLAYRYKTNLKIKAAKNWPTFHIGHVHICG